MRLLTRENWLNVYVSKERIFCDFTISTSFLEIPRHSKYNILSNALAQGFFAHGKDKAKSPRFWAVILFTSGHNDALQCQVAGQKSFFSPCIHPCILSLKMCTEINPYEQSCISVTIF